MLSHRHRRRTIFILTHGSIAMHVDLSKLGVLDHQQVSSPGRGWRDAVFSCMPDAACAAACSGMEFYKSFLVQMYASFPVSLALEDEMECSILFNANV